MTERERLPAGQNDEGVVERVEEKLREPIVPERDKDAPPVDHERANWKLVLGLIVGFGFFVAVIYALLINWASL